MAERRYVLHKLAAGDYLLLGNDGRTLWRLNRYEDGPSYGLESMDRDRQFWRVFRWPRPIVEGARLDEFDVGDLSRWHEAADMLSTRRAAIEIALRSSDEKGGR